jgi:hypothetical protein
MAAIPLRGDRSAWDAASYQTLHTNDVDTSASAIHHTLGIGSSQAASGDHSHPGSGSMVINHSHSGSQIGDGGKLNWNNVWTDSVHDHSSNGQGGILNLTSLSSGAAVSGYVLTADGSGSAVWNPPAPTIIPLDNLSDVYVPAPKDGDVLTWNALSGSWIAYRGVDWRVTLAQDITTDDSDKIFTAPPNTEWQILWIWVEYTSTATAGIRQLEIQIQDASSNIIGQFQTGVTQSEELVYKYLFGIGVGDLTSPRDDTNVTTPLPAGTFLSGGQKIRIWDNNTVDPTADDMVVKLQYASRNLSMEDFNPPLSINTSSQLHVSDEITFGTQNYMLSIINSSQLQLSDRLVLSGRFGILTIQNTTQIQTCDNIATSFHNVLRINSTTQTQTSNNTILIQYQILMIHNVSHKLSTETITLYAP